MIHCRCSSVLFLHPKMIVLKFNVFLLKFIGLLPEINNFLQTFYQLLWALSCGLFILPTVSSAIRTFTSVQCLKWRYFSRLLDKIYDVEYNGYRRSDRGHLRTRRLIHGQCEIHSDCHAARTIGKIHNWHATNAVSYAQNGTTIGVSCPSRSQMSAH